LKKTEIKILDGIWSIKVKEVVGYKCEYCKRSSIRLNACHIVGRRHRGTRWGAWLKNAKGKDYYDLCGFCGCFDCHNHYDEHGPKEKLIREKVVGTERYEKIRQKALYEVAKNQDFEVIQNDLLNYKK